VRRQASLDLLLNADRIIPARRVIVQVTQLNLVKELPGSKQLPGRAALLPDAAEQTGPAGPLIRARKIQPGLGDMLG
jgi:hypothetical protein